MTRFPSFGAYITVDWDGAAAFGTIGQVRDISGPSLTRNDIEVPPDHDQVSLGSNYTRHFPGVSRPGQLTFSINLDIQNIEHVGSHAHGTGLLNSFQETWSGTGLPTWHYRHASNIPGTATWSFRGYPVGMDFQMGAVEGSMAADLIIQISGVPTLTIT